MPPHRIHRAAPSSSPPPRPALTRSALLGPRAALAETSPPPDRPDSSTGFYRFKVGSFTITRCTTASDHARRGVRAERALDDVQRVLAGASCRAIPTSHSYRDGARHGPALVVFDTGDGPQPLGATTGRMMEICAPRASTRPRDPRRAQPLPTATTSAA